MMHPDAEAGITAHQIFTVLLIPASKLHRHELNLLRSGYLHKPKMLQSKTASSLSSATALLDKLRREKDSEMTQHHANDTLNDCKGKEPEEEFKQGRGHKNSPNFYRLTSIIDRTARSVISLDTEPNVVKLSKDQISKLLSAIWIESSFPDNMPSNFEAIAYSFSLVVISLRVRNGNQNSSVRFFQLPLSLRNMSMEHNYGTLPPSCERSLLTLATGMMMFMAKIYNIPAVLDFLKSLVPRDVDPYLGICDLQVYVKPHANIREFGSTSSQQAAFWNLMSWPSNCRNYLRKRTHYSLVHNQRELDYIRTGSLSQESFSFDGDVPTNSVLEDDAVSELSAVDMSCRRCLVHHSQLNLSALGSFYILLLRFLIRWLVRLYPFRLSHTAPWLANMWPSLQIRGKVVQLAGPIIW